MADPEAVFTPTEEVEEVYTSGATQVASNIINDEEQTDVEEEDTPSSNSILDSCKDYFDRKEFRYTFEDSSEDRALIKAGIGGVNGSYQMYVDIKKNRGIVIVYVMSNIKFPRAHRHKLCEYLTRANYSLVLGNFELDMNDGEVRYKCSTAVGPEGISYEVLDEMVPAAMGTMDRYFENMVKVSYGVMEPKPAVDDVEQGSTGSARGALQQMLAAASSDDSASATSGDASASLDASSLQNLFGQFLSTLGNAESGDRDGDSTATSQ